MAGSCKNEIRATAAIFVVYAIITILLMWGMDSWVGGYAWIAGLVLGLGVSGLLYHYMGRKIINKAVEKDASAKKGLEALDPLRY